MRPRRILRQVIFFHIGLAGGGRGGGYPRRILLDRGEDGFQPKLGQIGNPVEPSSHRSVSLVGTDLCEEAGGFESSGLAIGSASFGGFKSGRGHGHSGVVGFLVEDGVRAERRRCSG